MHVIHIVDYTYHTDVITVVCFSVCCVNQFVAVNDFYVIEGYLLLVIAQPNIQCCFQINLSISALC